MNVKIVSNVKVFKRRLYCFSSCLFRLTHLDASLTFLFLGIIPSPCLNSISLVFCHNWRGEQLVCKLSSGLRFQSEHQATTPSPRRYGAGR